MLDTELFSNYLNHPHKKGLQIPMLDTCENCKFAGTGALSIAHQPQQA